VPQQRVGLPVVAARIVSVAGMGLATAIAILLFLGGFWREGLISAAVALVFLGLMLFIERRAEGG